MARPFARAAQPDRRDDRRSLGRIEAYTLPAGLAAVVIHSGAYEQMPETYAALEKWLVAEGRAPAGAPWEVYVSDPAEHPDPADWRTEIFWPVR